MVRTGLKHKLIGASAALAMLIPTAAMAAPASSVPAMSPTVVLSLLASGQSRAALCGATAATAASAAATQGTPVQGCVLPAADAPVPVVQTSPLPVAVAERAPFISPLLLGLGAIALGIGLFAILHKSEGDRRPTSPG